MSCGCDNLKRRMDLSRVRNLALIASKMEGKDYVIYYSNGLYEFAEEGKGKGKIVERIKV